MKGTPTFTKFNFSPKEIERFWSKVDKKSEDECWAWTAGKFSDGYGQFKAKRPYRTHRVAYYLTKGDISEGLFVCHRCDNPICCNPFHLFLGTCAENHKDRDRKGRTAKGIRHGRHTMPEKTARGAKHGSRTMPEKFGIKTNIRTIEK